MKSCSPATRVLAVFTLAGLAGFAAAKPPDLPADAQILAAPQLGHPEGLPPVPNRWLDAEPVFTPAPAPQPHRHRVFTPRLGEAVGSSVLHTLQPLLALASSEKASRRPERLPMPRQVEIVCPGRQAPAVATPPPLPPSVRDNLRRLTQASAGLRRAEQLARQGRCCEAAECLEQARLLCAGSPLEARIERAARNLAAAEQPDEAEGAAEQEADSCHWLTGVGQFGLCPLTQAVEACAPLMARVVAREPQPSCFDRQMQHPVSLHFTNAPLGVVLDALRASSGLPLVVAGEVPQATPVSIHVEQMPCHVALNLVVRPLGLEPVIDDPVVRLARAPAPRPTAVPARAATGPVDQLMHACYQAIADGRQDRAAALARLAHRFDPRRVEGDPVVYKLDLLGAAAGRAAPPRRLPPTD